MKTDIRQHMSWGSRLRFFVRFVGISAVLAAGAGALVLSTVLTDWQPETLVKAIKTELGNRAFIGGALLGGGALLTLFALLVEGLSAVTGGASSRGAAGINAFAQIVIAVAIVGAVNVYAFLHDADFDVTRNKEFTLPANVVSELQKLQSETTIVVLQQHKTFGRLSEKPDRFDYAAERKVVEKVQDTVDLFRKFGSQFKVVVLDVEEEGYDKKLEALTKDNESLKLAIQAAPENSILFASEGKVQRMSFNEFYQLDKHASKEANNGKGNLVLYPQGIDNLVKRITAIEEKRPRVAVAVTHPYLSTQKRGKGLEALTLAGLRKSFTDYGFDVVDVVLKKNYRGELEGDPTSLTAQEAKLNELQDKLEVAKEELKQETRLGERLARNRKKIDEAQKKPLAGRLDLYLDVLSDLSRRRVALSPQDRQDEATQRQFEAFVLKRSEGLEKEHKLDMADAEESVKQLEKELQETLKQERAIEDRYLTDVKAKFTRLLDDCDLLIIPRHTIMSAPKGHVLPRNLHKIDKSQADVIKDFMKQGKPVLVCAGPVNAPYEGPLPDTFDDLEALLVDRGVELGKQTILFNVESQSFRAAGSDEDELTETSVDVPPLSFVPPDNWQSQGLAPNPIARSMEVLVNSVDNPLKISVDAPRPVVLSDAAQAKQSFLAEFLWTSPRSWNETYPFNFMIRNQMNPFTMQPQRVPVPMSRPRYDAAGDENKKSAGPNASVERRGPFSIAVAVESKLPESWYSEKDKTADEQKKTGRLVVIGHGAIFNAELQPATEKLLLVTSNWLLHRDERLPHAADPGAPNAVDRPWQYPRVAMSNETKDLWHWGAFVGLPAIFVYLGVIVLMLRRVR